LLQRCGGTSAAESLQPEMKVGFDMRLQRCSGTQCR
jgi:hypothetical protein